MKFSFVLIHFRDFSSAGVIWWQPLVWYPISQDPANPSAKLYVYIDPLMLLLKKIQNGWDTSQVLNYQTSNQKSDVLATM